MASTFSVQHKHFYGLAPTLDEGPRTIVKTYTVAAATTILDNLTKEIMQKEISFVQGMYFNNKLGGGIVTLLGSQAEQSIELANKTQGFLPLFWGQDPEFSVTFAAAGTVVFHFVNIPVAPQLWVTT
jgi:hypothetical protein